MSDERGTSDDSTRFTAGRGAADETRFTGVGAPPPGGSPSHTTFPPGSLIGHTYRIEALLARGGMGEVYRARHAELNTDHALKIILPELANNQRIVDLFRREASVLRTIRHDAVVAYDGVSRDENGRLYLVMEFVDGPSLSKLMRERTVRPPRRCASCATGWPTASRSRTTRASIHRDISPDNVILPGGDVDKAKIIDFGISKMADPEAEDHRRRRFRGQVLLRLARTARHVRRQGRRPFRHLQPRAGAGGGGAGRAARHGPVADLRHRGAAGGAGPQPGAGGGAGGPGGHAAARSGQAAAIDAGNDSSAGAARRPRSTLSDSSRRSSATKAGAGRMGAIAGRARRPGRGRRVPSAIGTGRAAPGAIT